MATNHGARQQKRAAKQEAKRAAKRASEARRSSEDPTIRFLHAAKWPVVQAMASAELWEEGIGYLVIARQEPERQLVVALFLLDVYCLGVKDAFWRACTHGEFAELVRKLSATQKMVALAPACLVKAIKGGVEFAESLGFPPPSDYRRAAMLLEGIDPSACPEQFTYGRDGKPFYIQGPTESPARAAAIMERVERAGGHFLVEVPPGGSDSLGLEDGDDEPINSCDDDEIAEED